MPVAFGMEPPVAFGLYLGIVPARVGSYFTDQTIGPAAPLLPYGLSSELCRAPLVVPGENISTLPDDGSVTAASGLINPSRSYDNYKGG